MRYGLFLLCCLILAFEHASAQDDGSIAWKNQAVLHAWHATRSPAPNLSFTLVNFGRGRTLEDMVGEMYEPCVAAIITINPEGRVKVEPGLVPMQFETGWNIPHLVKIVNEAGVTAKLTVQAVGDPQTTARFYESAALPSIPAITSQLSGHLEEYQAMLIRTLAKEKREITLSFQAGTGSQDLGFRAELPVLMSPRKTARLPAFERKPNAWLTVNAELRKQALNHLQDRFHMVAGSTVDRRGLSFDLKIESAENAGNVIRRKISYLNRDQQRQHAYLLLPRERTGKLPAVLCLHQTTKWGSAEPAGLGGLPNLHYALELAQRGYITLAPDYPGYGDATFIQTYGQDYDSTTCQGIIYHRRAVDLLCSLPEVDANRIGCMGHSLGGHNTLFLGLFDERIKAFATSCGFCSFPKYYGGNLKGWSHAGYMPRIASLYQCDPKQMPFDWPEVLAALAPRPVFINAPVGDENFNLDGVRDCVKFAQPVYDLLQKPKHLEVHHPQVGHDFPKDVREKCYGFFDRFLK